MICHKQYSICRCDRCENKTVFEALIGVKNNIVFVFVGMIARISTKVFVSMIGVKSNIVFVGVIGVKNNIVFVGMIGVKNNIVFVGMIGVKKNSICRHDKCEKQYSI